ncbi:hypothetical protein HMPREF9554_01892 [Treponema phagedenis F0421]|nr:hypothetical protein HMPREF9554_01892 [Treponema phagedenis F0421]
MTTVSKLTIGRSFENLRTFANEFKSFNFTVLCDALKHRLELIIAMLNLQAIITNTPITNSNLSTKRYTSAYCSVAILPRRRNTVCIGNYKNKQLLC